MANDHHHHHPGSTVAVTGAQSSVINAAAVAAAAHHSGAHHQQAGDSAQASALAHAGWSPNLGSMGHHAVVTDHSTLAYMTHAYQSHNTSVGDHHRSTNEPMSTQPIGTGHQPSSYGVDSIYNTPAAAVAAYGYNNYNAAAFFQTSNNGPHTQTGHPSAANLSNFWNQASQQRGAHTQPVGNQTAATVASTVQQRQPVVSEQTATYMHDPRIFYARHNAAPATAATGYGQGVQNFSQAQADALHHRMTSLPQQLMQQHEQRQIQVTNQQQSQLQHQASIGNQHQTSAVQSQLSAVLNQQHVQDNQTPASVPQGAISRQTSPSKLSQHIQKLSNESESQPAGQVTKQELDNNTTVSQSTVHKQASQSKEPLSTSSQSTSNDMNPKHAQANSSSMSSNTKPINNPSSVIKNETSSQYQRSKPAQQNNMQNRAPYRAPGSQPQALSEPAKKSSVDSSDARVPASSNKAQDTDLEDELGSLSLGPRKTTWASIASQPAKISQPKSLKSKIAGTNSVLSSAKHLAAVSIDTSSLETKNGINPAIKSSVSAAATSIARSSVPPPVSKVPSALASLKLNLLGDENIETSKISWPDVNASINLTLDDPPLKSTTSSGNSVVNNNNNDGSKKEEHQKSDARDSYKDYNHNQGSNAKMVNNYAHLSNRDSWSRRDGGPRGREYRDREREFRSRRDSDRDMEKRPEHLNDDNRDTMNPRRDYKPARGRGGSNFRGDDREPHFRDRELNKRGGPMHNRMELRGNEGYQDRRFNSNRPEPREPFQHSHNKESPATDAQHGQHHHYNNIRDGQNKANPAPKPDPLLHPHLNLSNFNPKVFNLEPVDARYFIIKSYSEDDIHRSIKYSIWCSTNHGNKRLDEAYRQQQSKNGPIYLFFSVNGSGHFCGMAQMMSSVDFDSSSGVWAQSKWQGEFSVKWIYVKDVPNSSLRHITLENNEGKPVTNSRDTQEVPSEKGKAVLKIIHQFSHTTSLFDDFLHYERRQEEEKLKKSHEVDQSPHRSMERDRQGGDNAGGRGDRNHHHNDRGLVGGNDRGSRFGRPYVNARPLNDFPGHRDRQSRFA